MIRSTAVLTLALCAMLPSTLVAGVPLPSILISEIRIDEPSTDNNEYFELRGIPETSLNGITYLVIGEQGTSSSGGIEMAFDLTGNTIPVDGYFLATESTFQNGAGQVFDGIMPDLSVAVNNLNFENSDNVTHLIVAGYSPAAFDPNFPLDVDINNDGILFPNDPNDPNVWTTVLDSVGFVEVLPGSPFTERVYGVELGFEDIGPDDDHLVPGMLFRDETQQDAWQIGEFSLADPNSFNDTPGIVNVESTDPTCDFNDDTFCNLDDMNLLFMEGNLVSGTISSDSKFDLAPAGSPDGTLNSDDVTEWLSLAGTNNDHASPYLRGDTDELGAVSPVTRDVDITDFNALAQNFDPTGVDDTAGNWHHGNFDGDGDIDITDFNFLASNFSPTDYGAGDVGQAIPEPAGAIMAALAMLLTITWGLSRRRG